MFDSVEDEVVRCTDPPGPNSRTAIVVSADTEDAATAARPRERMDLMVYYLDVILLGGNAKCYNTAAWSWSRMEGTLNRNAGKHLSEILTKLACMIFSYNLC